MESSARCGASLPGTQGRWDAAGWYTPYTRNGGSGTKLEEQTPHEGVALIGA